jgi:hypothetical protein
VIRAFGGARPIADMSEQFHTAKFPEVPLST